MKQPKWFDGEFPNEEHFQEHDGSAYPDPLVNPEFHALPNGKPVGETNGSI